VRPSRALVGAGRPLLLLRFLLPFEQDADGFADGLEELLVPNVGLFVRDRPAWAEIKAGLTEYQTMPGD